MTRSGARVSRVPIPSRAGVFDVDLGPGPSGRTVAAYSRCRGSTSSRGCRIFTYDFGRKRERRLREVDEPGRSEFSPSIWSRRIAYASRSDHPRTASDRLGEVRVRSITGRGGVRRYSGSVAPSLAGQTVAAVNSIDQRERTTVFAWRVDVERCRTGDAGRAPDPTGGPESHHELWLAGDGGSQVLVERGCGADPVTGFLSPNLSSDELTYGVSSGARRRIRSYRPRSREYFEGRAVNSLRSYVELGSSAVQSRESRGTRIEELPAVRRSPALPYPSTSEIGPPVGTAVPAESR